MDNERFLGRKVSAAGVTVISKTSEEENFEAREAVYEARRAEIQHKLRFLIIMWKICLTFLNSGHLLKTFMRFVEDSWRTSDTSTTSLSMSQGHRI